MFWKCFGKSNISKKNEFSSFHDYKTLTVNTYFEFSDIIIHELSKLVQSKMIEENIYGNSFQQFLLDVYENYRTDLPYHNQQHIIDVFQFSMCLIQRHRNLLWNLSKNDIFTFCLAVLTYDIGHDGKSNEDVSGVNLSFTDNDDISLCSSTYSSSCNEINHIIIGSCLLKKYGLVYNHGLYNKLIFITDMQYHHSFVKNTFDYNPFYGNQVDITYNQTKVDVLRLFLKISDIGHIMRPWNNHVKHVIGFNNERKYPLELIELASATINFNNTFVLPLLGKIKEINIGLYYKLSKYYLINMNNWKILNNFFL